MNSRYQTKDGAWHDHQSVLLRQAWKQDGKVRRHTIAPLTHLPADQVDALEAVFNRGARPQDPAAVAGVELGAGLSHGAVAAAWEMSRKLGLPAMVGPESRERDIVMGLVAAGVCHPGSKIAQASWWADTTLGEDLGLAGAGKDEVCRAMDWLLERKDQVEAALAGKFLKDPGANPAGLVFYDLTSTWVEGDRCQLAKRGHSRDKKKGKRQIEFALVAAPGGIPVAVRVFPGNTADPAAFKDAITAVKDQFKMDVAIMVGDRGMVTGTRIDDLRERDGLGWVGALDRPQIAALAGDGGPLQLTLFDQSDLFRFTSEKYPGEVLIACRNPFSQAAAKARRQDLIDATTADIAKIPLKGRDRKPKTASQLERAVGRAVNKRKVGKFLTVEVADGQIAVARDPDAIAKAEAIDGVYAIRTSLTEDEMAPADVVRVYKRLSRVEADFKMLKSVDMQVRPVRHWVDGRVEAHLLVCLLAAVVAWHLRRAWAPLTFEDEAEPAPTTPSKPAKRSDHADQKASRRAREDGIPLRPFAGLLAHLALMTRNPVTVNTHAGAVAFTEVSRATPDQAEAFKLIGAKIPPKIAYKNNRG
ncbi:MAG: IS1634 family transposase [Bifidobacteriaceae bacterium]|nr:IS1634 family transposase [Bifidobacteriaceae bacterium]